MQCIGECFGVDAANADHQKLYSIRPASLSSLVDVFVQAAHKKQRASASGSGAEVRPSVVAASFAP